MAIKIREEHPSHAMFAIGMLGARIAEVRKLRKVSAQVLAEQVNISHPTLKKIEKGDPGVAFGTYVAVIFALGIADSLASIFSSVERTPNAARSEYRSLLWANPQADDSMFIRAALQKPKIVVLADIVRDYGLARVMDEWGALKETPAGRKVAIDVNRMLKHLAS